MLYFVINICKMPLQNLINNKFFSHFCAQSLWRVCLISISSWGWTLVNAWFVRWKSQCVIFIWSVISRFSWNLFATPNLMSRWKLGIFVGKNGWKKSGFSRRFPKTMILTVNNCHFFKSSYENDLILYSEKRNSPFLFKCFFIDQF